MPNVYGTKQYEEYLKQCDQFIREKAQDKYEWTLYDTIIKTYKEYKAQLGLYIQKNLEDERKTLFEATKLTIEKNGEQIYACPNMLDRCDLLYFFNYNGQDYLLFRKDLYGYALLNLETLEEHNYFPSAVVEHDESFIVTDAHLFRDILILEGCFWACPYSCYLLDLKTFKTHDLRRETFNSNDNIQIKENSATIIYYDDDDNPDPVTYSYEELSALLEKSDSYDLAY